MSVPSFFEIYSTPNVLLLLSLEYCGLVDDVFLVAVVLNRAIVLVSSLAVAAASPVISALAVDYLVVVALDGLFHIFTTAVGNFDSASVWDWAQGVPFWEV